MELKTNEVQSSSNQFEIKSGQRNISIKEGNIADCSEYAVFILNLEDTEFPAPGPVFGAIIDKDEKLEGKSDRSNNIYDLVLEAAKTIPNSQLVNDQDSLTGEKFKKAIFPSRPYTVTSVDVASAGWPRLKTILFGNIGTKNDGILVRIWQPTEAQISKLKEELRTLFTNLYTRLEAEKIQSVAMQILTGHRAPARLFFEVVGELAEKGKIPSDLTIYTYEPEDYQSALQVLKNNLVEV